MNATANTFPVAPITVNDNNPRGYVHGYAPRGNWSQEFRAWHQMRQRCSNPNMKYFYNYGGRGIVVCDRWNHSTAFPSFIADLGQKPSPKHSLDRIKNNLHYSCGHCPHCIGRGWSANVRWATKLEQDNNRRTTVMLTHGGVTMSIAQWARRIGMSYPTLSARLQKGWPIARALDEKTNPKCRLISFDGKTMTLSEWAKTVGISPELLWYRLKQGWSIRDAIFAIPNGQRLPRYHPENT